MSGRTEWMIYDANGYTGHLIGAEARRRGLHIVSNILRHWLPSGCCVATAELYPSRTTSSVVRSRDYRHVL
jgi:hypothetical protein